MAEEELVGERECSADHRPENEEHAERFRTLIGASEVERVRVTGSVKLQPGVEMVMPGDNAQFDIELGSPIAMEEQQRFAVREGGKTVGAGVVTKILE